MSIGADVFLESLRNGNFDTSSQQMDYELAFRGLLDEIISQISVIEVEGPRCLRSPYQTECCHCPFYTNAACSLCSNYLLTNSIGSISKMYGISPESISPTYNLTDDERRIYHKEACTIFV